MLLELDLKDLKEVVGILQARFVKKRVDEFLCQQEENIFEGIAPTKKKAEKQNLRKFGNEGNEGFFYTQGNFISHETGAGSLLDPSREMKQFDGNIDPNDISNLKIPFIKRMGQFSNACLYRRCNGTIFFGVADGKRWGIDMERLLVSLWKYIMLANLKNG